MKFQLKNSLSHAEYSEESRLSGRFDGMKGFALLVVLLIIAVLTAMVGEFMFSTKLHAELMANHRDRVKARYLARSAINAYRYLLELNQVRPGQVLYGTSSWVGYGSGIENLEGADAMSAMLGLGDSPLSPAADGPLKGQWSIPLPGGGFELDGTVHGRLINERGKININGIVRVVNPNDRTLDVANTDVYYQLKTLTQLRGVDEEDADVCMDSLVDWIDDNSGVEPYGAEMDYYRSLDTPYYPRNDHLISVEEMLLVQGCTADLYERIKDFVTVYPRLEGQNQNKPDSCIVADAAPKMVLMALFLAARPPGSDIPFNDPDVASDVADEILKKAVEKASLTVSVSPDGAFSVNAGRGLTIQDVNSIIAPRLQGNIIKQFCQLNRASPQFYTAIGAGEVNDVLSVIEAVFEYHQNSVAILRWNEE